MVKFVPLLLLVNRDAMRKFRRTLYQKPMPYAFYTSIYFGWLVVITAIWPIVIFHTFMLIFIM